MALKNYAKHLLKEADDGYRDSDTEYRLYVRREDTPYAAKSLHHKLSRSGLDYKEVDCGAYLYVTLDEVAEHGLTEEDLDYCEDLRGYHRHQEEQSRQHEQRELEKTARLVGNYEAVLAIYLEQPTERLVLAKRLAQTAREVLR
jgi:hypothetical protein